MSSMRGTTQNTCPPRKRSRWIASRSTTPSQGMMKVRTASRSTGGVRDDAHLPHAGQRQLQGARDRRRGQRQHVHVRPELLQPLLVRHAEMLLLVHHHQAELGELDALGQQRVGADDDVDRAVLDPLPHLGRFLRPAPCARAAPPSPAAPRSARRRRGSAGARAGWSAPPPPPARRSSPPRRPRAAPPPSCRSPHRRRSAGPWAGRRRGPPARRRWHAAGRRSRRRGSGRRTRPRRPPAGSPSRPPSPCARRRRG